MMYITYGHAEISIDIALLKKRIKTVVIWILKVIRTTAIIGGIFLLLGTAGASDLNDITFSQMLYQMFISLLLFGMAYALEFIRIIME